MHYMVSSFVIVQFFLSVGAVFILEGGGGGGGGGRGGGEGREGLIKLFLIEMKKSVEMLHSDEISSQTEEV